MAAEAFRHGPLDFTPITPGDVAMLRAWLGEPHVRRWWSPAEDKIAGMRAALADGSVDMHIVSDGAPFGFVQNYDLRAEGDPALQPQPEGARGIDYFIGPPDAVGRGLGSAMLRALSGQLLTRYPRVLADPSPENAASCRALLRAGFRDAGGRALAAGPARLFVKDTADA